MSSVTPEAAADSAAGGSGTPSPSSHQYTEPVKRIKNEAMLPVWEKSQAYQDLLAFVQLLNRCVEGKVLPQKEESHPSEVCKQLVEMLDSMDKWIDEIPPKDGPQRFGNGAFRDWHKRLEENASSLIMKILPEELSQAALELQAYLKDGFGNYTRIDYGSGHELNYAAFLCCLYKLRVLSEQDSIDVALSIFSRYIDLTRRLQTVYRMEPAGSHGVWGLDDFQFIPFIWGSSQLIGHRELSPEDFHSEANAEKYHRDYMFMGCIRYIYQSKTGPFFEHSPTLWGMTSVRRWQKINSGLIKMYKGEVLNKFPIVQHFLFGTILSFDLAK